MERHTRPVFALRVACTAAMLALASEAHALVFTWTSGDYLAQGFPATLDAASVVNAVAGGGKSVSGLVVIEGRINWLSGDTLTFAASGATLRNNGFFDQQADGLMAAPAPALFDNNGTLAKTGGSGDLTINVGVVNRTGATLDAASGRIVYRNDAVFEGGTRFAGAGAHVLSGVTRTYTFGGDFGGPGRLFFEAGTYRASAPVTAQADITWAAGTMSGNWRIAAGRTLSAVPAGTGKTVTGSLVNDGSIAWATEGALNLGADATLRNNGTFDQQGDGTVATAAAASFDNAGSLRKTGGSGDLRINTAFTNRAGALLDAGSGRIVYRGDSLFEAGTRFSGGGSHVFSGVLQTYTFGGDFAGQNRLLFEAGTYQASAPTAPQTDITFAAGTFAGAWRIDSGRTLTAVAAGTGKTIRGSFVNDGTIAWTTDGALNLAADAAGIATLRNNGTFDQRSDGSIATQGSALFDNAGLLRKTDGAGDLRIGTRLVNTGTIESRAGNIVLPQNWRNDGRLRGNAAFQTNLLTNAGDIAPGLPDPDDAIATLALTGALLETAAGTLSFDVGAGGIADLFTVSGTVGFGGTARVSRWGSYVPQVGDRFRVMTFSAASGLLLDVQALGFGAGVVFEPIYGATFLDLRVSAVPEPDAWMLLAAGGLMLASRRIGTAFNRPAPAPGSCA